MCASIDAVLARHYRHPTSFSSLRSRVCEMTRARSFRSSRCSILARVPIATLADSSGAGRLPPGPRCAATRQPPPPPPPLRLPTCRNNLAMALILLVSASCFIFSANICESRFTENRGMRFSAVAASSSSSSASASAAASAAAAAAAVQRDCMSPESDVTPPRGNEAATPAHTRQASRALATYLSHEVIAAHCKTECRKRRNINYF